MGGPSLGLWCGLEKGAVPLSCPQRDTAPTLRTGGQAEWGSGFEEATQPVALPSGEVPCEHACPGGWALLAKRG